MKIALFGNEFPSNYIKYINHLITKLESENVELIIHHKFHDFLQDSINFSEETKTFERITSDENIDFLFSIGGDGTLLKAVTYVRESNIPILGINTGRLGFISSISTDQIDVAVDNVLKGEYKIRSRTVLQLETENKIKEVELTFQISIDDLPERHNKVRKIKNLFDSCIDTYRTLKNMNIKNINPVVNITVSQENCGQIEEIFNYFTKERMVFVINANCSWSNSVCIGNEITSFIN